ncbi:MAG: type VI secretion protein IcmF/TssM N-terminal domain-containing protein, partial [Gemmatimonadaceae bacterium]
MMQMLRDKLPLIMIVLAGLILLAFAIYSYTRDDEEEDEDDLDAGSTMKMSGSHAANTLELPGGDDYGARRSRMIALKDSLERSLSTRTGVKASGGLDRLAMPWFMLVGAEGSGKRSLLSSTGLPLPYGAPVEVDSSKKDAGRWWLFEDAVVVEAPTVKPAPKAPTPSDSTAATSALGLDSSEGWNNLLHLLRRERPDSPLNGIVVAVSCADLVGSRRKNPEELAEQAELIKAFLDRTRRVLGIRLPVHILITRCDVLPGFRSFAETLPEPRRDDVFGWANPRPLEKVFEPAWIESGFLEVQQWLDSLHDELLAAPEKIHDADGLFVFVNEFSELQDPLVDFIGKLMPSGERRASLFLRGVYFTGDPSERAARAAVESDDATLHISLEATEAESHSLVFLRSLFAEKIFKEAGLARTASPLKVSRDFKVLGAQAAALMIALLGGAGLWASLYGFQSTGGSRGAALTDNASELRTLMTGVAIDLYQIKRRGAGQDTALERRLQDAAVINLVNEMRSVSSQKLRSIFVPSSWFSPLPAEISASVVNGVQAVVLPIARQRLQGRVEDLL